MEALSSFGNSEQNQLKLSVPRAGYIAQAFAGFTAELDISHNMEIYMRETNALQTICDVKEKNYDFGIIRYQTIHEKYFQDFLLEKGIVSEPIWNFEMKALMSSIHPLAERDEIELQPLREMSVELLWGDTGVPYLSPSASLNNAVKKGTDNRRIYIFDRGSIFDILCSVKKSFMLVSPLPEDMCHRYDLVQRKCVFTDNNYKDVLIYSSDHKLTETEFRFIDKIYEVRNRTAFGDCR
jgi:DNA-binding transcriptional LysR family regulator